VQCGLLWPSEVFIPVPVALLSAIREPSHKSELLRHYFIERKRIVRSQFDSGLSERTETRDDLWLEYHRSISMAAGELSAE
jgi:hypothetical protein